MLLDKVATAFELFFLGKLFRAVCLHAHQVRRLARMVSVPRLRPALPHPLRR